MGKSILITGGARSGKSAFAERLTTSLGTPMTYIATTQVQDDEMAERVASHRDRRDENWRLIEEPFDLPRTLNETDGRGPRLVDCLTVWLSNLMHAERDWRAEVERLTQTLTKQNSPVILVTNEVGGGIVPENAVARRFRDAAGLTNQRVATTADEVWLVVSGCPLKVKPNDA